MKKIDYTTVEELLLSDGFLKWYQKTDEKETQAWDDWIAKNPEHQRLAYEAVQVLLLFREAQEHKIGEQEVSSNKSFGSIDPGYEMQLLSTS